MMMFSENPAINWAVIGLLLLGLEMFTGTFVVMFFAFGAFVTGAITWLGILESASVQIVVFALVSGASLFFFRDKLRLSLRGHKHDLPGDIGIMVTVENEVEHGAQTEVQYQGARWIAINDSGATLSKGAAVKVAKIDGVKLILK